MKKLLSLILAMTILMIPCAWAEEEEDWYLIRAAELAKDLQELSADEAYIGMMGGSEEIHALIAEWNQAMQKEPISVRKGTLPMAEVMALTASGMGVGEVGTTQVERSSIAMVINVLIGQRGTDFLAASATVQIAKGYVEPEEFEPCVVVYEYEDIAVAVSFGKIGEGVVTSGARFCPTEICDLLTTDEEEGVGAVINEEMKSILGK